MESWRKELYENYLMHYGIKGQKKGVRRYQNEDGSLTPEGEERYLVGNPVQVGRRPHARTATYATGSGIQAEVKKGDTVKNIALKSLLKKAVGASNGEHGGGGKKLEESTSEKDRPHARTATYVTGSGIQAEVKKGENINSVKIKKELEAEDKEYEDAKSYYTQLIKHAEDNLKNYFSQEPTDENGKRLKQKWEEDIRYYNEALARATKTHKQKRIDISKKYQNKSVGPVGKK